MAPAPEPALLNSSPASGLAVRTGPGRVVGTDSRVLFEALAAVYAQLGFGVLEDEVFAALVLARVVEPTSLLDAAGCWPIWVRRLPATRRWGAP